MGYECFDILISKFKKSCQNWGLWCTLWVERGACCIPDSLQAPPFCAMACIFELKTWQAAGPSSSLFSCSYSYLHEWLLVHFSKDLVPTSIPSTWSSPWQSPLSTLTQWLSLLTLPWPHRYLANHHTNAHSNQCHDHHHCTWQAWQLCTPNSSFISKSAGMTTIIPLTAFLPQ